MTNLKPLENLKPSTRRMRALMERRKQKIELPNCKICNAKCTAQQSIEFEMCAGCRRLTPQGRQEVRKQVKQLYYRQKYLKQYLDQIGIELDPSKWTWDSAEHSKPASGIEVIAKTVRGALCVVKYDHNQGWIDPLDNSRVQVAQIVQSYKTT